MRRAVKLRGGEERRVVDEAEVIHELRDELLRGEAAEPSALRLGYRAFGRESAERRMKGDRRRAEVHSMN